MKNNFLLVFLFILAARTLLPAATYLTVNFGTIPGLLKDGEGIDLDGTFTAQLGTFDGFVPLSSNTDQWGASWKIFAQTTVDVTVDGPNIQLGANILVNNSDGDIDGYSSDPNADAYNFSNQQAWFWVKNGEDIQTTGTEWFLASIGTWLFPEVIGGAGCCPAGVPLDWSLSQLNATSDVPEWGSQGAYEGGGTATVNDPNQNLQTHAIPEPGALVMLSALLSSIGLLYIFRRRENHA